MQPHYTLFIDMCLTKPREADNVWVRLVKTIPFVPREGDTIRISPDVEGDSPLDVTLENVVYDCEDGVFIEEQSDNTMCDTYREEGLLHEQDVLASYTKYGFIRLTFPVGVATAR